MDAPMMFTVLHSICDIFLDESEEQAIVHCQCNFNRIYAILGNYSKREDVPRIHGYAENTVPRFLEEDFQMHYRIRMTMFHELVRNLAGDLVRKHGGGIEEVSPYKQMLVFLYYMSNKVTLRELSHCFGLDISTVHGLLKRVSRCLNEKMISVIKWPDLQEQQDISDAFQLQRGLAGIIGAVDGTHIRLTSALGGDADYINRKGFPSMVLQVVCDNRLMIRHIHTGWPGCSHDARVLRNSSLVEICVNPNEMGQDKYLLGDSAYPLQQWLITPFKDNGHLTVQQRRFNGIVSSSRQVVERCIGHMKGRFRKLTEISLHDPDDIVEIIKSGCILSNLCIIENDDIEQFININPDNDPNQYPNICIDRQTGVLRRRQLMNNLL